MILLTAFEPFTTSSGIFISPNPSALIVERLVGERPGLGSAILPVAFRQTEDTLRETLQQHSPTTWIGLGVAVNREQIELETIALNVAHTAGHDNQGARPRDRALIKGAPLAYRTPLDVAELAEKLAGEGLPVTQSHHAGTFLCNAAYYVACHWFALHGGPSSAPLFVHIPPFEQVPLETTTAVVGRLCDMLEHERVHT